MLTSSFSAYEDKRKQKRNEIVDRPWFSSPKTNDTLKKLAFVGKSPSSKFLVPLNSLGVVCRKSKDTKQVSSEGESNTSDAPAQVNRQDSGASEMLLDSSTRPSGGSQKAEGSPPSSFAASLVADYSDSASGSEAELWTEFMGREKIRPEMVCKSVSFFSSKQTKVLFADGTWSSWNTWIEMSVCLWVCVKKREKSAHILLSYIICTCSPII